MDLDRDEIVRLLEAYGGQYGLNHTRRLLQLVTVIGEGLPYDADIVWVAAHLHDWGAYSPWAQEGVDHVLRSTQVAQNFLAEKGFPQEAARQVIECIAFHHAAGSDHSIEALLLRDADALDFLGVIGVLRDFSRQPKAMRKAYEAARKHREKLGQVVCLEKSKQIAAHRLQEMDALLAAFEAESFGYF